MANTKRSSQMERQDGSPPAVQPRRVKANQKIAWYSVEEERLECALISARKVAMQECDSSRVAARY